MNDITAGIITLLGLFVISSLLAIWLKSLLEERKALNEFSDTSEGGALIQHGITKNRRTGRTRGQKRPSAVSVS